MASSLVLLLPFSVFILFVNGHLSQDNTILDIHTRHIAENELRQQHEILWIDQHAPISLQVKSEPTVTRGKNEKLYRKVRVPPKMMDRQVRKKSGYVHRSVKRGASIADKQARKKTMIAHNLLKRGVINLDKQLSRGSKIAHDSVKRSSSWLDNKLVAGTRTTHRSVKRGLIPIDKGVAVGSVKAYGTVKKGVTTVDKKLKNGVRAIDKQVTTGKMKGVPVNFFLNKFISRKGKKDKSAASLPPPSEPEPKGSEAHDTAAEDEHGMVPFESEAESAPPSSPISSTEEKRSEEMSNSVGGHADGHEEEKEKEEEKKEEEGKGEHEGSESQKEEPADFDMDDFDNFEDAKHEEHDHHEDDHDAHGNLEGEARSPTPKKSTKRYFQLGKFDSNTLKQFAPRSPYKPPIKSLRRSLSSVSKPLSSLPKFNTRSLRSLSKKSRSIRA